MRTTKQALREIQNRIWYFCAHTDGTWSPPWAQEVYEIAEEGLSNNAAPGNAAAMRSALERIVGWCEGCHADACEKVCRPELTSESIHAALAALAAPARNCDRFATHNEAWAAFLRSYFGPTEPEFVEAAFTAWLFAPAEGGAE